jgi:beta-lactamase regulating signal transducer with metallopeptidase domain/cephalosporin hydroxylase
VIYLFWVLVALRLLLPFDVPVSVTAARYLPPAPWTYTGDFDAVPSVSASAPVVPNSVAPPAAASLREILLNEKTLAIVWAAGVATVLLAYFWASLSFRRQLSRSGRRAGKRTEQAVSSCSRAMGLNPIPVLEMDALSGPALFGVWRPRLLFPLGLADQLSDEELRLVVLHELGHLKRRDLLLQGLLVLSQAVHWFNPLVWLAGRLAREDRELACDEFVMAHTSHSGGHAYAKTLLRVLGLSRPGRSMLPAVGILETKNQIKQRIIMITKYQSTNARRLMLGTASILAVSAGLLMVNAAESGSNASAAADASSGAPEGWWKNGSAPAAYDVGIDSTQPYKKPVSVYVKSLDPKASEGKFGGMMQMCNAESFRGKRLKFTGYVKTRDVVGTANLWFRVDGENEQLLAFDNMQDRPIKGTTDWKEYSVVLNVPETATALAYGIFISGAGMAWLNDVQMIEVGSDVKSTNIADLSTSPQNKLPDAPQNLDFSVTESGFNASAPASASSSAPKGWWKNGSNSEAYDVGIDSTQPYKKPVTVYVKSLDPKASEGKFGGMMQMCRAESFRGKRLKFTGYVKTRDVAGTANLWFRVDGENGQLLAFDNMSDRPIKGTTDWKEYSVVLDVPETATALAYGIFVSGAGTAWLNDVQLIEVGSGVKSTATKLPDAPQNLDFSNGK